MSVHPANEPMFTFRSDGYGRELRVLHLSGTEGMSELFHFGIQLASRDAEIDWDALVGLPARFDIRHVDTVRTVCGIISHFEQGTGRGDSTRYFAELVPTVWLLTQRYQSRIFQNATARDIVTEVLTAAGIRSNSFRFALRRSDYSKREYCVQYRESDWNFIARLLEEEGIFYFFEHKNERDVLVMADSAEANVPITGNRTVLFRAPSGLVELEEFVHEFSYSQRIRSGKVTLRDFNFERPTLDLTRASSASRNPELEVYDYPGLYTVGDPGGELARLRREATQTRRLSGIGKSVCHRLIPGSTFTLRDCPRSTLNQEYLLTWLQHEGTQPLGQDEAGGRFFYNNEFQCIPTSVPFRPARETPKPVVEGSQTAIVTGPTGEEIYTDKYGRVKVHFHWDREGKSDDTSSCWVRVAQLWAGAGWGAIFIPRVGQEVIVDFLEGDPDRPIITGCVYNGDNMPPYTLDAEKTKSTIKSNSSKDGGGFNELRFEDKKGSEEIYQHAQKDLKVVTVNDKTQETGRDESLQIGRHRIKSIKGNETTTIDGNRDATVQKDERIIVRRGSRRVKIKDADQLSAKTIRVSADQQILFEVGGNSIKLTRAGIEINGVRIKELAATTIEVTATGITTVKGSLVRINC